jgi:hypothetical protein
VEAIKSAKIVVEDTVASVIVWHNEEDFLYGGIKEEDHLETRINMQMEILQKL